jgi:hypothetical protein
MSQKKKNGKNPRHHPSSYPPGYIITPINVPLRRSKRTAAELAAVRMTMTTIRSSPKKKKKT